MRQMYNKVFKVSKKNESLFFFDFKKYNIGEYNHQKKYKFGE
jgi:hypothetical protein